MCGLLKLPLGRDKQHCQSHFLGQSKSATPSSKWICHMVLLGAQRAKNVKCTGKKAATSPAAVFGHPMASWTLPLSRVDVLGVLCGDVPDTLLLLLFALRETDRRTP